MAEIGAVSVADGVPMEKIAQAAENDGPGSNEEQIFCSSHLFLLDL